MVARMPGHGRRFFAAHRSPIAGQRAVVAPLRPGLFYRWHDDGRSGATGRVPRAAPRTGRGRRMTTVRIRRGSSGAPRGAAPPASFFTLSKRKGLLSGSRLPRPAPRHARPATQPVSEQNIATGYSGPARRWHDDGRSGATGRVPRAAPRTGRRRGPDRSRQSRLGNALRFASLRERPGTSAGIAQIRQEPSQIEFISVGKNINCRNRSVQRQVIVHHPIDCPRPPNCDRSLHHDVPRNGPYPARCRLQQLCGRPRARRDCRRLGGTQRKRTARIRRTSQSTELIAISGIYDLEPIRLNYLNEKLGLDTAEVERNSPVRHLPAMAGELVWLTVPGNCPNCAASRSSMPGRGENGVFRDACCR
jgi:hypothetical protein